MANGFDNPFDDDPKDLQRKALDARSLAIEQQPDILRQQVQSLKQTGGGFEQAINFEEDFLGLAGDFLDPDAQAKRFASVREQLLGSRERQGLFGATGDEAVSIQGLAALDELRRQDIGFARNLTNQSFFNPNMASNFGLVSPEALLGQSSQNQQFGANLAFNRRMARAQADANQMAAIGQAGGMVAGAAATGGSSFALGAGGSGFLSPFLGSLGGSFAPQERK